MNSLLSTPLVPEKEVYPVCTNGLQTGTMVVTSQNKMCNAKRHYIATYLDKPTDFKCVYAGILVAFVIGVIVGILAMSIASFGTGAVIAGILVATLVGIIASYGLGGAVCRYCLERAVWDKFHPNIIIDGKFAIVGSSKLICTPLPFLTPGTIQIFYSKDVANRVAEIYATQNVLRIFNGAGFGAGVGAIGLCIGGVVLHGITTGTMVTVAIGGASIIASPHISEFEDKISDYLSETDGSVYKIKGESSFNFDDYTENANAVVNSYQITKSTTLKECSIVQGKVTMQEAHKMTKIAKSNDPSLSYNDVFRENLKVANKEYNVSKNRFAKNNASKASIKELKPTLKNVAIIFGFTVSFDIIGNLIWKHMAKDLDEWKNDEEAESKAKIGIYERGV